MNVIIFEDEQWHHFAPLVYTRPLAALRCGAFTLQERLDAMLNGHPPGLRHDDGNGPLDGAAPSTLAGIPDAIFDPTPPPHPVGCICRPHLMGFYGPTGGFRTLISESVPIVLINARVLNLNWLPDLLQAPIETVYTTDNTLVAAHLSPSLASAVLYYLLEQNSEEALHELQRFARVVDMTAPMLTYPWDLISHTGEQLVRDIPLLRHRLPPYRPDDPTITTRGGEHIYVASTAHLDGPIVLDSRDGPIFIDEQAHIEPFSFIQGPTYIGKQSLISSALIRGETSIGPVCRIGGEVEASIMQSFSNKHHEGFLGHSWIGEWVNIGAMTTNSDLKNNYGNVRVTIEGVGNIDSGVLKLGAFLADHVKLGIGLHLTGGSVIGVGSNIFGIHMVPKTIPPFTWGSEVFREYRIDSLINVTRKVMGRRKQVMTSEYETLLRSVFAMTRDSRGTLQGLLQHTPSPPGPGDGEAALARAEADAIRAFG
jgi:UDP-N-acetylglucosamine diphosphorylase/glucosamine-1-phosphate N-acetyltransferase